MKQRIENYIPKAIELVKKVKIANEENEVKNEFNGYFSAFGAAIIQSGLKPALAFYANEKTAKERSKILKAIYVLITNEDIKKPDELGADKLLQYVIASSEQEEILKDNIIDASIALKLAVRTYKLLKS